MSASLIVLIPLVLLGIVGTLCFVGCAQILGLQPWQNPTYTSTVSADPNFVAMWPLSDPPTSMTAVAIPPAFSGNYAGAVTPGASNIVLGDLPATSASFSGGNVAVGFSQLLNTAEFTIEAWVKPSWAADDDQVRVVATSDVLTKAGFVLFKNQTNFWAFGVETDAGLQQVAFSLPIDVTAVSYLAGSFNATTMTLTLFVGVVGTDSAPLPVTQPLQKDTKFMPEVPPDTSPFFIGLGHPDTGGGDSFSGLIQDVAYYKAALDIGTIFNHYNFGRVAAG